MLAPALLVGVSCAGSNTPTPVATPDRILAVDASGKVLRQSTAGDHSTVVFDAPRFRVWSALVASYAELGIQPSIADAVSGQYGNASFLVPRRILGQPIGQFFDCGSSLTGAMVDAGRVTGLVVTTLSSRPDSTTSASTQVTGTLRRNDGSSSDPILCSSTGAIEEQLRIITTQRLESVP